MIQVNIHEAKTRLSELLERVQNGEQVTIAKAGKPIAELSRIRKPKRQPGFLKGFYVPEDFDAPDEELIRLFEEGLIFPQTKSVDGQ
jgi:prevent-host-death family protein